MDLHRAGDADLDPLMVLTNWIVAFHQGDPTRRWWDAFTFHRPGFGHCFALGWCEGFWLQYEWFDEGLHMELIPDDALEEHVANLVLLQDARFLTLPPGFKPYGMGWGTLLTPRYCVAAVKHLIGLPSFAATPWQLFCALRRAGATEIFETVREAVHGRHGRIGLREDEARGPVRREDPGDPEPQGQEDWGDCRPEPAEPTGRPCHADHGPRRRPVSRPGKLRSVLAEIGGAPWA
jgi:hypothetical protein